MYTAGPSSEALEIADTACLRIKHVGENRWHCKYTLTKAMRKRDPSVGRRGHRGCLFGDGADCHR